MNDERYIRQTSLKEFGHSAQKKLSEAKVLVVGAGGLGLPVLQYLNAMGVGTIGIVEQDIVDLSNLQRQVLYYEDDLGKPKLNVCLEKLKAQNSNTIFRTYDTFLVKDNALKIIKEYDLVIDATDNFPSRYLINDACVILKKPYVYGALHGFEGQLSVFNYKGGPTYRCLFPEMPSSEEIPNCNDNGVLGIIPGIVGNLQALEAIKMLTGKGEVLTGKLLLFNGLNNTFTKINFPAVPDNLNISKLENNYEILQCTHGIEINIDKLKLLLNSEKEIQLIDVRNLEEYRRNHIPEALNIPLSEIESRIHEINIDTPVYLICQSGIRSKLAQKKLQEIHPSCETNNVIGGMDKYDLVYL